MAKKKLSAFERSFVAARRSGAKDFSFGGKKYNTKLAGGGGKKPSRGKKTPTPSPSPATPAKAPTPTARPKQPSTSVPATPSRAAPPAGQPNKDRTPTQPRRVATPPAAAKPTPSRATPPPSAGKDTRPTQPRRVVTPPAAPKMDSNLGWKARDVADTRKRMEEATAPRPGKKGGIPTTKGPPTPTPRPNRVEVGAVSASTLPKGKTSEARMARDGGPVRGYVGFVEDASVNRGVSGKTTEIGGTKFSAPPSGKTARLPDTREVKTTAKTARLPPAVRTAPKTGRLKKTTVVARN